MRLDTSFLMMAGIGLVVAVDSLVQSQPAKIVSPEGHSDRRVTFRLRAPKATQVKVWGEWILRSNTLEEMKQGEDRILSRRHFGKGA